ncbi:MAG: T9SS type A sorting domain-containing protein [candidate division Zixibacteria bacterium]|nr:T9SS type A sorting domain-containing protein [candidate division Zixibacteria bacterium]
MKKSNFIWLGVIIFLFFTFLSTYSSEIKPSAKAVNEETDGCNCRGDLDRNGVINPVDLEYMAKVIQHEISPDPSLAECADLNYNGLSYEMSDYAILQSWMSAYHVILCGKEKLTGDLNLNLIPYEPADAVLFLNYFMDGTAVFTIDSAQQIANSDIDGNGKVLTLSDFVLMIRIMLYSAVPGDTTGYSDKIAYYTTSIRDSIFLFSFNSEAPVGAALFTFNCSDDLAMPYLYSTNMDLIYKINNNELRVLVFSFGGANIPSGPVDLLALPLNSVCTLISLEVVDDKGNIMEAKLGTTGISEQSAQNLPEDFVLSSNYPNPFNPETYIEYALPSDCQVALVVYNILGQKVRTLVDAYQAAGFKSVIWDGKDDSGNQVSAGVYFYSIKTDNFIQTKKMLLLK